MPNRHLIVLILVFRLTESLLSFALPSSSSQNQSPTDGLAPQVATLIINEYLADPPSGASGDANGDGVRDGTQDEFIELVNTGAVPLPIGMFTISDSAQTRFTFPAGKVISAGECAVVFGGGAPIGAFGNATANGLVFTVGASEGLSLNNGGDTITIKDNLGAIVTSLTYGSSEGGAGQSITRSPDVSGSFVKHSTAAGSNAALFSPGTRVGGAPFITSAPVITSISPNGVIAGSSFATMTVNGMNFLGGAQLRVDGVPVFTALFSSELIEAQIPESVTATPGTRSITVQNPGGAVSNSVPFTVLGQIGINEYLADPPAGLAGDANGDGVRDSSQDEFVEIVNRTPDPIDVGGFTISDADAQRFRFPNGTIIPGGEAAVIFGGGTPQGSFGNAKANGLVFTALLSLNNSGDKIILKNAAGVAIESITYGSTEGSAAQSLNRNPDLSGITLVHHSAIGGGRLFSPGTRVDGSPFTVALNLTSIVPNSATQGDTEFDMAVNGNGFDGASTVLINGKPMLTAFLSPAQLIAHVTENILAVSGAYPVQVRNSGGNRSNVLTFTVIAPPPVLLSLTPRTVLAGSSTFTLFLSGANFTSGAVAVVDGTQVNTTFTSARELRANVPASLIATVGTRRVVVRATDGRESNALPFEVIQPTVILNSITPAQA
ncbi:MAG TPA: lamin tail domain-containing protein, partial [Blastocatellia bacterium]